ncbi:hypothetical protein [Lysobacter xanthus]
MKKIGMFGAALGLLAVMGTSGAQVRPMMVPPVTGMARPAAVGAVVDRDAAVDRRLSSLSKKTRALEGRVATLEAALREMRAATEYTCSAPSVSRNGRGATEDCGPYACNYLDGRCRTTSVDSSQCAAGFLWDGSNHCVPAPTGSSDD